MGKLKDFIHACKSAFVAGYKGNPLPPLPKTTPEPAAQQPAILVSVSMGHARMRRTPSPRERQYMDYDRYSHRLDKTTEFSRYYRLM